MARAKSQASPTFDIRRYLTSDELRVLRILGKYKWIEPVLLSVQPSGCRLSVAFPSLPPEVADLRDIYRNVCNDLQLLHCYVRSIVVSGGVKLVAPSLELCEAMEQTAVNVTWSEFAPPYPAMVFKWPDEWRPCGCRLQVTWMGKLDTGTYFGTDYDRMAKGFMGCGYDTTIEQDIQASQGQDSHGDAYISAIRVVSNVCLLMTAYRWGEVPLGCGGRKRLKRRLRSKRRRVRDSAQAILESLPEQTLLQFEQNIKLFRRMESAEGNGTGRPKKPHWRRGYVRRQAYGPGWALHRTLFVPPVLVNRKRFVGDVADTKVTYHV